MTGSVHAAIGALIGSKIKCKPLAFAAGMFSHFAGDVVPHHDMGITETPLVFATLARIGQVHGWNSSEMWAAIGGVCPDFEHIPYELRKDPRRFEPMEEKFFPTHNGTVDHGRWKFPEWTGEAMQVALWLSCLYLAGTIGPKKK